LSREFVVFWLTAYRLPLPPLLIPGFSVLLFRRRNLSAPFWT
jgi:hypothetical protein